MFSTASRGVRAFATPASPAFRSIVGVVPSRGTTGVTSTTGITHRYPIILGEPLHSVFQWVKTSKGAPKNQGLLAQSQRSVKTLYRQLKNNNLVTSSIRAKNFGKVICAYWRRGYLPERYELKPPTENTRPDHQLSLNEIKLTIQKFTSSPDIKDEIVDCIRYYANHALNGCFIDTELNDLLNHTMQGKKVSTYANKPINGGPRYMSLSDAINYAWNKGARAYHFNRDIIVTKPETETKPETWKEYESGEHFYAEMIKTRSYMADNFSGGVKIIAAERGYIITENEGKLLDKMQIFLQGLQELISTKPASAQNISKYKNDFKGGAFNISFMNYTTRNELIDNISELVETYLGDTNFTYESYFNGTYVGENPIPTKEQRLEDANFTIFLSTLLNKLSSGEMDGLSSDLEILFNRFPVNHTNSARNNGRPYIQRELASGHLMGGTRKCGYYKKTRKASKGRKGKRYSRRR
jgi:hypothetical protein